MARKGWFGLIPARWGQHSCLLVFVCLPRGSGSCAIPCLGLPQGSTAHTIPFPHVLHLVWSTPMGHHAQNRNCIALGKPASPTLDVCPPILFYFPRGI